MKIACVNAVGRRQVRLPFVCSLRSHLLAQRNRVVQQKCGCIAAIKIACVNVVASWQVRLPFVWSLRCQLLAQGMRTSLQCIDLLMHAQCWQQVIHCALFSTPCCACIAMCEGDVAAAAAAGAPAIGGAQVVASCPASAAGAAPATPASTAGGSTKGATACAQAAVGKCKEEW